MTIKYLTLFIALSFFVFPHCGPGSSSKQEYVEKIDSLQSINDSLQKSIEEDRYKAYIKDKGKQEALNLSSVQIGAVFDGYVSLGMDYHRAVKNERGMSGKNYSDLRRDREYYHEFLLIPAMAEMVKIVKDDPDSILVFKFINVLIHDSGSASELPGQYLIELAQQNPELLLRVMANFKTSFLKDIYQTIIYQFCDENTKAEEFEEKFARLKSRVGNVVESEFENIDICNP